MPDPVSEAHRPLQVYLDTNHWHYLAAALAGHPRQHSDVEVLLQLQRLVLHGAIHLPLSAVHYFEIEETPSDRRRREVADVVLRLSQFRTIAPPHLVIEAELEQALHELYGHPVVPKPLEIFGFGSGFAMGRHMSGRVESSSGGELSQQQRVQFEAALRMSVADFEAWANVVAEHWLLVGPNRENANQIPGYNPYGARELVRTALVGLNVMSANLRNDPDLSRRPKDVIFARQLADDLYGIFGKVLLRAGLVGGDYPFQTKEDYTALLLAMPSRIAVAEVQLAYHRYLRRDWTINDARDMMSVSVAVPYCDVFVADKQVWDAVVNRTDLSKRFSSVVLRNLAELGDWLTVSGIGTKGTTT